MFSSSRFTQLLAATLLTCSSVSAFPESNVILAPRASNLGARQQIQNPVEICRWWSHGSTQIGNRIFVDGGLKTYHDTKNDFTNGGMFVQYTMSQIDISRGFKIPLREDDREYTRGGSPNANGEATFQSALFNDGDTTIYKFGGQFVDNKTWADIPQTEVRPAQVWKFDTTRALWEEADFTVTDNKKIVRPMAGAYASAPKLDKAYYLGGIVNPKTDPTFENLPYSGYGVLGDSLLELDMSSMVFTNYSTPGVEPSAYGNLVYIENFGRKGVLVLLGGGTANAEEWIGADGATGRDLSTIDVYDIDANHWYKQKTSGTPPTSRLAACAAVIAAPDGSSQNILFYGGMTMSSMALGDTWILSLPSFTWTLIDDSGEKRLEHTCHVVKGNKLLVIGGRDPFQDSTGNPAKNYTLDPTNWSCLKDGMVSVLDLNEITWLNELPSAEEEWAIPTVLTDVIGGDKSGGADFLEPEGGWDDSALGSVLFIDDPKPGPDEPTENPPKKKDGPPVAVIVGGVVGGVVVLAIIGAIVWCVSKRKKKSATTPAVTTLTEEPKPTPAVVEQTPPVQPQSPGFYDPRMSAYDPNAAAYWASMGYQYDPNSVAAQQYQPVPVGSPPPPAHVAEVHGDTAVGTAGTGFYAPVKKEGNGDAAGAAAAPGLTQQKSNSPLNATELA